MPSELPSSYTAALAEAYASAPSDVITLQTIEVRHESIASPLYLVQAQQNMEFTLETGATVVFKAIPFKVVLPQAGANGLQEISLTIDNIDRMVTQFFRVAKEFRTPVKVLYRPYLASDPSQPQMIPPLTLFLKDASITVTEVSARATLGDLVNRKYPRDLYTREQFPSLGE